MYFLIVVLKFRFSILLRLGLIRYGDLRELLTFVRDSFHRLRTFLRKRGKSPLQLHSFVELCAGRAFFRHQSLDTGRDSVGIDRPRDEFTEVEIERLSPSATQFGSLFGVSERNGENSSYRPCISRCDCEGNRMRRTKGSTTIVRYIGARARKDARSFGERKREPPDLIG